MMPLWPSSSAAYRGGPEAEPEQAVVRGRAAAADEVAEHDDARLLAGERLSSSATFWPTPPSRSAWPTDLPSTR